MPAPYEVRDATVAVVHDREYHAIFVERYRDGALRLSQRGDGHRDEIFITADGWQGLLDAVAELGG